MKSLLQSLRQSFDQEEFHNCDNLEAKVSKWQLIILLLYKNSHPTSGISLIAYLHSFNEYLETTGGFLLADVPHLCRRWYSSRSASLMRSASDWQRSTLPQLSRENRHIMTPCAGKRQPNHKKRKWARGLILCCISYHIISYHIISCHTVSYHIVYGYVKMYIYTLFGFVSFLAISCHSMPFHVISYHVIFQCPCRCDIIDPFLVNL